MRKGRIDSFIITCWAGVIVLYLVIWFGLWHFGYWGWDKFIGPNFLTGGGP